MLEQRFSGLKERNRKIMEPCSSYAWIWCLFLLSESYYLPDPAFFSFSFLLLNRSLANINLRKKAKNCRAKEQKILTPYVTDRSWRRQEGSKGNPRPGLTIGDKRFPLLFSLSSCPSFSYVNIGTRCLEERERNLHHVWHVGAKHIPLSFLVPDGSDFTFLYSSFMHVQTLGKILC